MAINRKIKLFFWNHWVAVCVVIFLIFILFAPIFALSRVDSLDLKDKPPHHLSLGQKRAVSIATVVAMQPDILVMDEPAANLDPKSRRQLINHLKEFKHSKIIASHDLDLILDVCERCIVIGNGRVMADGPAKELLINERLLKENSLELPLSKQAGSF